MKTRITIAFLTALAFGLPAITGCDETVKDEKKVEVKDDGTVKKTEEKVVKEADGAKRNKVIKVWEQVQPVAAK